MYDVHSSKFFATVALVGFVSGIIGGAVGVQWVQQRAAHGPTPSTVDNRVSTPVPTGGDPTIAVVKKASPSVVSIIIKKRQSVSQLQQTPFDNFFDFPGFPFSITPQPQPQQQPVPHGKGSEVVVGGGSGFIVSSDGTIVTNKHVVSDDTAQYVVITNDGKEYPATVAAQDPVNDMAIIKIKATGLPPLILGDSSKIEIGQTVIAIGNSLSEYRNTVTRGVISGIGRRVVAGSPTGESEVIDQAIQTDAAINPGNSGGPLLTLDGTVIGINTAINQEGQSIGFAIPSNVAKQVLESFQKNGRIIRPWLGVRYSLIDADSAKRNQLPVDHGALIVRGSSAQELAVIPGSPADTAGLKENDIILEVNGTDVTTDHPLGEVVATYKPGDVIQLKILRNGKEQTVKVTLAEYK